MIQPGRNKISVAYKGINYLANLGKDGVIMYQGEAIAVFDLLPASGKPQISVCQGLLPLQGCNSPAILIDAGKKFGSATAFSIHCKRMQTPNKQGDDGWKSTLYDGQSLESYRRKYFQESGLDGDDAEVGKQSMVLYNFVCMTACM